MELSLLGHLNLAIGRGGPKLRPRWAGAPPRKEKFSAKFRRKSCPHPLKFFVCTPWNFLSAPLGIFRSHPLGKKVLATYILKIFFSKLLFYKKYYLNYLTFST
ncbi:hypothetical protein Hanom_Chr04g00322121 [Helianthus anomalus]